MIEFGIHSVESVYQQKIHITGRVFHGIVKIGTCFTQAFELEHTAPEFIPKRNKTAELHLTVESVQAYGIDLDNLDEGLTGLLILSGYGIEHLHSGVSIAAV